MKTVIRVASGVIGGIGTAFILYSLLVGYAFATMCPPGLAPADRWLMILERISGPQELVALGVIYTVLNTFLFLCVKAKANPPTFWVNTVRHLLVSSLLTPALIFMLLVPFLLRSE